MAVLITFGGTTVSKRRPGHLALGAILALGSCNGPTANHRFTNMDAERLDIANLDARNALARVDALEARIQALETRAAQQDGRTAAGSRKSK